MPLLCLYAELKQSLDLFLKNNRTLKNSESHSKEIKFLTQKIENIYNDVTFFFFL